jgi:hypothetical protein
MTDYQDLPDPGTVEADEHDARVSLLSASKPAAPMQPTEAMLNAARDWSVKKYGQGIGKDGAVGCWQAMLAASPAATSADAQDEHGAFDIALDALAEYQQNWDTGLPAEYASAERIQMECAVEAVREALTEARAALQSPAHPTDAAPPQSNLTSNAAESNDRQIDAPAQSGHMADAYTGAREDLSIWKKRALEAEALNRKFIAEINGPMHMGEPVLSAAICDHNYVSGQCTKCRCIHAGE